MMKFKLPTFFKIILISNILFALLLVISSSASIVNPQIFWLIALLGLAYPILFLINLIFFLYWFVRLKKYAFISGLTLLLGFNIALNYFGFRLPYNYSLKNKTGRSLRIMTYNVHNFEDINKIPRYSYQKILKTIKAQNPDVITLEEFYQNSGRFNICDSLKKMLHTEHYYFEPFLKTPNDSTGLAIFSKFPIVNRNLIRLSNAKNDNQGIVVDIKSSYGILRVYCFHLQSIMLNAGDFEVMRHKQYYRKYLKYTIEKFKTAYVKRAQQALMIKKQTEKCTYPYIFAGDFNDPPNSYAFHIMSEGLKNAFKAKGSGYGITFNQGVPIFQIDYILASPQFEVMNYQIIKQKISDHYPILADLSLK